jgi:eukaryotic-like serine/threonine-protein kinase
MSAAPKRWNEISQYLEQALTLGDEDRAAWLHELRKRDAALGDELELLLEEHRAIAEEQFMEHPPIAMPLQPLLAGQTIGPYKLTGVIGEGGMGTVWAAERCDGRFRGRVAVKFLNFALHGPTGQARFAREGSILGRLAHPHVARLMDAGVSTAGQPYLVLEHIEGEQIDRYCDQHRLDVEQRLRLFVDVLSAVAHAHAHLIVHRDVKPSNVLVQGDGEVKLLDFGIAKLLEDEEHAGSATLLTCEGGGAFTPQYAAPEQLTGGTITTATDVYALGVVLYVLLTGQHPTGERTSPAELVKAITTTDPRRMSDAVAKAAQHGASETNRRTSSDRLRRTLRGDLDTIVAKALKKTAQERYSSVVAFAEDIRRYLDHRPISARPDTLPYRAAKFVRRNRSVVALATVALIAIAAGVAGTLVQARKAREERDFAFRQLSRAEAINDLQNYVLSNAAPSGKPFTVTELLGRAEHIVEREQGDPATHVRLLISIGGQYKAADQYKKSQQMLQEAYRLSKNIAEPAIRASAACQLGQAVSRSGDDARAEALWKEGLNALPENPLYTLERVSCWLRGSEIAINAQRSDEAVTRALTARQLLTQSPVHSDPEDLGSIIVLASAYNHAQRRGEAIAAYKLASERLKSLGRDDTEMASSMLNNWGLTLLRAGQPLQAETIFQRVLEIDRDGSGESSVTPTTLSNYAYVLYQLGRLDRAADYAERAYTKAVASGDEMAAGQALMHRARIYRAKGDPARSAEMLSEVRSRLEGKARPGALPFAVLAAELALNARAAGDLRKAKRLIDDAINTMEALGRAGRGSPEYEGKMLTQRSEIEFQLGQTADAVADASRGLPMVQQASVPGGSSVDVGRANLVLGRGLQAQGKSEPAQAALRSAAENLEATLGLDHPDTVEARQLAGLRSQPRSSRP